MGERVGLHRFLQFAAVYDGVQRLLGGRRARGRFVARLGITAGTRLLDIGCGTGELVRYLPAGVDYLGYDPNPAYVTQARRRHGTHAQFLEGSAKNPPDTRGYFDLILATGVLHHLDDSEVGRLLDQVSECLAPAGAFVALDPVLHEGQSWISRFLVGRDRGLHVRTTEGYLALFDRHALEAESELFTDLLRLPYSHLMIRARPNCRISS
jgi:SAM-dependent methyltransferase